VSTRKKSVTPTKLSPKEIGNEKETILVPLNQNVLIIKIWGVRDKTNFYTNKTINKKNRE